MPRIIRSLPAQRDAIQIWLYIAEDNPDAANRLLDAFDEKLAQVAEMPGLGRPHEELAPQLRSVRVGNYLLFYRPVKGGIELIRILHGARDIPDQFPR